MEIQHKLDKLQHEYRYDEEQQARYTVRVCTSGDIETWAEYMQHATHQKHVMTGISDNTYIDYCVICVMHIAYP